MLSKLTPLTEFSQHWVCFNLSKLHNRSHQNQNLVNCNAVTIALPHVKQFRHFRGIYMGGQSYTMNVSFLSVADLGIQIPDCHFGWIPIFKGMFRHRRDKMVVYGYIRCNSFKFDRNMLNSRHFRVMLSVASMAKTIFWVNQLVVLPSSAIIFMENTVKNTVLANTSGHVLRVECNANTSFHENVLLVTFWFTYFEKMPR